MQTNYTNIPQNCKDSTTANSKIIDLQTARANQTRAKLKGLFASSPRLQQLMVKNQGQQALDTVLDQKPATEEPRNFTDAEVSEVDRLLAAALNDDEPEQPIQVSAKCDRVEYITDGGTIRMIKADVQPDQVARPVISAEVIKFPGAFEQPRHAPATRPPALLGLKPLTDATMRQYQTLDVEYLHTSGHRKPLVITGEFRKRYAKHVALAERLQDLMQSPTLDAEAVAAFVTMPVPFAVKAELLGLTERQQHGLLAICSDRQRKRYKATHERANEALATIQRKTKANHAHLVSDRFLVWQCRQLTGGQAMEVAHLRELAGGPKADRSNAAGALKTLAKIGV